MNQVRRAFIDTPDGQVHVRIAGTNDGAKLPLLLLHQSPASSLTYQEILPFLGKGRVAIAIDTPGFGESFRPSSQPGIPDYARWIAEVPASLDYRRYDLFGLFTGAAIASQLATAEPDRVRRLVLAGPPVFTAEQQARFVEDAWPMRPQQDGSHLMREWNRVMTRPMNGVPFDRRCDAFNEYYRGGSNAIWGEQAVAKFSLSDILPSVRAKTLVLQPQGIHGDCAKATALLADAKLEEVGHSGYSMLQAVPEKIARQICDFLDGK